MAGEIEISYSSLRTVYAIVRNSVGQVYSSSGTGGFSSWLDGSYANYPISLTEQGTSAFYAGDMPAVAAGTYNLVAKNQVGGSPAITDPTIGEGSLEWGGSRTVPLSDLATSGQIGQIAPIRMAKGVALSGFPIYMVSAADHVTPLTSGVLSGQISRNGGSFGPLQSGNFSETGLGWYRVNLTSGDLNADVVALNFSAAGADPRNVGIVMQRTSGS